MKKLLAAMFVALLMVGCGDPGEKAINVISSTTILRGTDFHTETENVTVLVGDLQWRKEKGVWVGTAGSSRQPKYKPADKEAVKAINDYLSN